MNNFNHITFDLETLGVNFDAPIVQIGAVKFKSDGEITGCFDVNIEWSDLSNYNFNPDYSTLLFWLSQDREAQNSISNQMGALSLKEALAAFLDWVQFPENYQYWCHKDFDVPILKNCLMLTGLSQLPYRNINDIRTLEKLVPIDKPERVGIHHTALDDATFQAKYISEMFKSYKK